jgi:hypothetical protein
MPKTTPFIMFHSPENTRVAESDIEPLMAKAIINGSNVPKSPRAPEISEMGEVRRVEMLLAPCRRSKARAMVIVTKDSLRVVWECSFDRAKPGQSIFALLSKYDSGQSCP